MHVHAPSEHTFNGETKDVELHLIHQAYNSSSVAIVAIFFDVEEGGNKTSNFINSWMFEKTNPVTPLIPLQQLIKRVEKEEMYHYVGSLTEPPCTEGV